MSTDATVNFLNAYNLATQGGPSGSDSDHDQTADALRHFRVTDHDRAAHLAANPYSLDSHPTEHFPPLQPRTARDTDALPVQPDVVEHPWDFLKHDWQSIWQDPNHGFVHKVLDTVAMPSHAISSALHHATGAVEGEDHDLSQTVFNALSVGHGSDNQYSLTNYLRAFVGMGAATLADPLTWVGFPELKKGEEAMHFLSQAVHTGEELGSGMKTASRLGTDLRPENIKRAAEGLTQQRMQAPVKAMVESGEDIFAPHNAPHASALAKLQEDAYSQAGHTATPGHTPVGREVFERDYLDPLRRGVAGPTHTGIEAGEFVTTPWKVTHRGGVTAPAESSLEEFLGPNVGQAGEWTHEERLANLARRQVLNEKEIEHAVPSLRVFGAKTPIPSPFPAVSRLISRTIGRWTEKTGLSQTLGPLIDAGHLTEDDARLVLGPGVKDVRSVPVGAYHDVLQGMQTGSRSVDKRIAKQGIAPNNILTGKPAKQFGSNFALSHAPQDQMRALDALINSHKALLHVATTEGANVAAKGFNRVRGGVQMATKPEDLQGAIEQLEKVKKELANTPSFYQDWLKKHGGKFVTDTPTLSFPTVGTHLPTYQDAAKYRFERSFDKLQSVLGHGKALDSALDASIASKDPNALMQVMQGAHGALQGLHTDDVRFAVQEFLEAQHDLIHSHTPAHVVTDALQSRLYYGAKGNEVGTMAKVMAALPNRMREHGHGNSIALMAKFEAPFWKNLMTAEYQGVGAPSDSGLVQQLLYNIAQQGGETPQQMRDRLVAMLKQETDAAHQAGHISAEGARNVHTTLDALDPEGLYRMASTMKHLSKLAKPGTDAVERLSQYGLDDLHGWISKLIENGTHAANRFSLPFEQSWGYSHWVHDPNRLGEVWAQRLEPMVNAAMRFAGWPQRLIEGATQYDGESHGAKRKASEQFQRFWRDEFPGLVTSHGGQDVGGQALKDIDQAVVRVWDNEASVLPDAERTRLEVLKQTGTISGADQKLLDVDEIARAHTKAGRDVLEAHFGGAAGADQFLRAVKNHVNDHHFQNMMQREVAQGHSVPSVADYLPRYLTGTESDKREVYRTLDEMHHNELWGGSPVLSKQAGYERQKAFRSQSEWEWELQRVAEKRLQARSRPLAVGVDDSLASRLAMRSLQHHRAMANLNFIRTLSDAVPQHVLPFVMPRGGAAKELAKVAQRHGLKDVRELVPALDGWLVKPRLFEFIRDSIGFPQETSGAAAVAEVFGRPLRVLQDLIKRANVSTSLVHVKNTMANPILTGHADILPDAAKIVADAIRDTKGKGYKFLSPVTPVARALQDTPLHKLGVQHGLFRAGSEYELPMQTIVRMHTEPSSLKQGFWNWVKRANGPANQLTFDLTDTALRMAMFRKFMRQGFTPARAAEVANSAMIDYSQRYLTSGARNTLRSLLTFPAYKMGVWGIHAPEMVRNPAMYKVLANAADTVNHHEDGVPHNSELPTALAGAIATGHTVPGTSNTYWVNPQLPSQSIANLMRIVTDEMASGHPVAATYKAGSYSFQSMRDVFHWLASFNQPGGLHAVEKLTPADVLVGKTIKPGKPVDTGLMGSLTWGLEPYGIPEFAKVLFDPREWQHIPEATQQLRLPGLDTAGWLGNILTRTEEVTPSGKVIF